MGISKYTFLLSQVICLNTFYDYNKTAENKRFYYQNDCLMI